MSTSEGGTTFDYSFDGVNTAGIELGVGEDFSFPSGSSGRYVRLTGVLAIDQWLSINEVRNGASSDLAFLVGCIGRLMYVWSPYTRSINSEAEFG